MFDKLVPGNFGRELRDLEEDLLYTFFLYNLYYILTISVFRI